jgi:hypothetical protein
LEIGKLVEFKVFLSFPTVSNYLNISGEISIVKLLKMARPFSCSDG